MLNRPVNRLLAAIGVVCVLHAGCQQADVGATQTPDPVYAAENDPARLGTPYVLLISIDGYRHDYNALYAPPNLTRFAEAGVQATSLIPSYPSDTFPNHYSIVTGMFPGTHGIVANNFFDPARDADYRPGDAATVTDGTWYGGTPLWSAAEQNGMVAASYFWLGSEAEIAGTRPSYWEVYDTAVPHAERISTVLEWLSYPEAYRPHFITLYFSSVDTAGHTWGPESEQVRDAVLALDADLGVLFAGLDELDTPVNVFIVSDHGNVGVNTDDVIDLDEIADLDALRSVNTGSNMYLYVDDAGRRDEVYADLAAGEDNYRVFLSDRTPDAWHADHPRFGQIVIAADAGYTLRSGSPMGVNGGNHGYDPYLFWNMRGIFWARGPDLVSRTSIPGFSNVHIYPLIMELLGLESPPDIDGRLEVLEGILSD